MEDEKALLTTVTWFLLLRYDLNQLTDSTEKLHDLSLSSRMVSSGQNANWRGVYSYIHKLHDLSFSSRMDQSG